MKLLVNDFVNMKLQAHTLFWLAVPVILLIRVPNFNSAIDFQLNDTYLIVAFWHISVFMAVLFGVIGIVYWILEKMGASMKRWLSLLHFMLSFLMAIVFIFSSKQSDEMTYTMDIPAEQLAHFQRVQVFVTTIILLFLAAQLLFLVNLAIGLFRRKSLH
jgi:heme/copper-type cytochrome/quinol oxidase subunit 1